jgi:hypothetical protein
MARYQNAGYTPEWRRQRKDRMIAGRRRALALREMKPERSASSRLL